MTGDGWKYDLEEYIKQGEPNAIEKITKMQSKVQLLMIQYVKIALWKNWSF